MSGDWRERGWPKDPDIWVPEAGLPPPPHLAPQTICIFADSTCSSTPIHPNQGSGGLPQDTWGGLSHTLPSPKPTLDPSPISMRYLCGCRASSMTGIMLVRFLAKLMRSRPERWENSTAQTRPSQKTSNKNDNQFSCMEYLLWPIYCVQFSRSVVFDSATP